MKSTCFFADQEKILEEMGSSAVVPFPIEIPRCNALNATPYVVKLKTLGEMFAGSERRKLLFRNLERVFEEALQGGARLECLLVGGSFLDRTNSFPKDIDCVYFYSALRHPSEVSSELSLVWERAIRTSIDVRFIPYDADPVIALKACSFFSSLYGRTRASAELSRGCILVSP
jgi:hypothetical protein